MTNQSPPGPTIVEIKAKTKLPSFVEELKHAWQIFKLNLVNFIKFYFLTFIVGVGVTIVAMVALAVPLIANVAHLNLVQTNPSQFFSMIPIWSWIVVAVVVCLLIIFVILFNLAIGAGWMLIANNETEAELSSIRLFKQGWHFVPGLLALLFIGLFFAGSFWFFVIPWIVIIFFMIFANYELVLEKQQPWQAVKNSFRLFSQFGGAIILRLILLGLISGVISLIYQALSGVSQSPQSGASLTILIFIGQQILQLLLGWFTIVFVVRLYKDVKTAANNDKPVSITWAIVVSFVGWFIFAIMMSLMITTLKHSMNQEMWSKLTNQVTREIEAKQPSSTGEKLNLLPSQPLNYPN